MSNCICCGRTGKHSIQLAVGPNGNRPGERYYLPNKSARDNGANIQERWFCSEHMRALEDAVRATIVYHQAENGIEPVKLGNPS